MYLAGTGRAPPEHEQHRTGHARASAERAEWRQAHPREGRRARPTRSAAAQGTIDVRPGRRRHATGSLRPLTRLTSGVAWPHAHRSADSMPSSLGRIRTAGAAHSARLAVHDLVRHRDGARGHRRARAHRRRRGLGRDRHRRGTAVLERVHAGSVGCRHPLADPRAAHRRTLAAEDVAAHPRALQRPPHGEGRSRARDARRGAARGGPLARRATSARAGPRAVRGLGRHPARPRDARRCRGRLPRRGLRAHQAQDQARPRHRRDAARCARRSAASRCRSTRTPPTRSPTSTRSPSSTSSTCCSSSSRCRRTTSSTTPRSRGTCAPPSASMSRSCRSRPRRDALALGAASVINIKAGRVGGYLEAVGIHDLCRDAGVPVWCGGHGRDRHRPRRERGARGPARLHAARATCRRRAGSTTATS